MNEDSMKSHKFYPKIACWLFRRFMFHYAWLSSMGDLDEEFMLLVKERGLKKARLWYWQQVIQSIPFCLHYRIGWSFSLFQNYVKIAVRNIQRNKVFYFINILGLAVGIAAFLLVYMFIHDELSYDKFHEKGDQLFRVVRVNYNRATGKQEDRDPYLPPAMGPELETVLDGIKHMTRMMWCTGTVRYRNRIFRETIQLVDSPFFEMFSFTLVSGNPRTLLNRHDAIVLTRAYAEKYFGLEDPLGKLMTVTYGQTKKDFIVTGIAEDVPSNSSIQFDILMHIANLAIVDNDPQVLNDWNRWYFPFYIQLEEQVSGERIDHELDLFCKQYFSAKIEVTRSLGEWTHEGIPFSFRLQRLDDIYIDSRGLTPSFILLAIAMMILIIAGVNFTNISIGLSAVRLKEVGMRKVMGAGKKHLILQFWSEALLLSVLSMGLGFFIAYGLLSRFNSLSGKELSFSFFFHGSHVIAVFIITGITGVLAGSYPALILSGFNLGDILKKQFRLGRKTRLTRGLVVLQFTLSAFLIISALILGNQIRFLLNKELGYEKEGLVAVMTQEIDQRSSEILYHRFRERIIMHDQVVGITASNRGFGLFLPGTMFEHGSVKFNYRYNRVDPHFISTMGLILVQGRDFLPDMSTDKQSVVVSQCFLRALGPQFNIGQLIGQPSRGFPYNCRVIGIIQDCHFESLRSEIDPLLLYVGEGLAPRRNIFSRIFIRIKTDYLAETMAFLKKVWYDIEPGKPFITYFQDEAVNRMYMQEERWRAIIQYASYLSIIIACLGISGLTAITITRRVKEIGIRKVLGAKAPQIAWMIISEYVVLVAVANAISWPFTYWLMKYVLRNYAYRVAIGFHYFLLVGLFTVFIAVLVICYLAVKAARANPVETLRYE